jgi:hypothetical protein
LLLVLQLLMQATQRPLLLQLLCLPLVLLMWMAMLPLLQVEFGQLNVDECQQLGSPNSNLCSLLCAVKAQQRLLMSGVVISIQRVNDAACAEPSA